MIQKPCFYGTATIGTKGQIVIPAKAREEFSLQTGDTVVIMGIKDHNVLSILPTEKLESLLEELTRKMEGIRQVLHDTQSK